MTQEDFDNLINEIREEDPDQLSSEFQGEELIKEDQITKFEQKAGFKFPGRIPVFR